MTDRPEEKLALGLLAHPTRHLFFTGKGGVGKTSLAAATALALSDAGKSVLLVSTDAASNLDEMLGAELKDTPTPVPGAPGLLVMNIDPEAAADAYRGRVLAQMAPDASEAERATVREELSGACTTEIAAFDEFAALLADRVEAYDHVIFDTAPTGHTLRLLSLPKAWTGFLKDNDRGASCLGPHSGLKMQEDRFKTALASLGDAALTAVVLVTRPEKGAIAEASRTSEELRALGLGNQRLAINGVFHASDPQDRTAHSLEVSGREAIAGMSPQLSALPRDEIPLRGFNMMGLAALRALLSAQPSYVEAAVAVGPMKAHAGLDRLADELAAVGPGLVMVMGKGGVGKTTIASALAIGLVKRGKAVHLSTTDPAAHLAMTLAGEMPGLRVDRIDPKRETKDYIDKMVAARGPSLNPDELDLLREDLASPCTEEVAVFHAFSRTVREAKDAYVVLDTAPTGHTLLLMDATGAYHRQTMREFDATSHGHIVTPLMRLQDASYTRIILVTVPEPTPVLQAQALQADLRRARIETYGWVVNKSLAAAGTSDPLLKARLLGELRQMERIERELSERIFVVPWQAEPPIGLDALSELVSGQTDRN
ncbi:MAG: arsenical pump-driving ATPase [Caulobacteraceae bacterium]|nr:arsenical pump-driving ATPase [Caulobacteraceae bacterium]